LLKNRDFFEHIFDRSVYQSMRGKSQAQPQLLTVVNLNAQVPPDHPLRSIKRRAEAVLVRLSPLFNDLYAKEGRPSIPPEQLLKACLLIALFSVRSERLFCEQLGYNLLWLWFLDRELSEGSFDHSVFAKNKERVLSAEVAHLFFAEVYEMARQERWTSDDHFTVDGTLIESWASRKSFARKDGGDEPKRQEAKKDDPGNPTVDYRGEKQCNQTHQSTTDPESVLYRKARGKEAKLCFGGHVLMENRNGLCADFTLHNPIAQGEPVVALQQLDAPVRLYRGVEPKTVGADQGYYWQKFVDGCRERKVSPHVACRPRRQLEGLDGRTVDKPGSLLSQRVRKRIEEIFGWIKTVGGLRRSRYLGLVRTQAIAYFVVGAYNLLRMARLEQMAA
jgi:transposase